MTNQNTTTIKISAGFAAAAATLLDYDGIRKSTKYIWGIPAPEKGLILATFDGPTINFLYDQNGSAGNEFLFCPPKTLKNKAKAKRSKFGKPLFVEISPMSHTATLIRNKEPKNQIEQPENRWAIEESDLVVSPELINKYIPKEAYFNFLKQARKTFEISNMPLSDIINTALQSTISEEGKAKALSEAATLYPFQEIQHYSSNKIRHVMNAMSLIFPHDQNLQIIPSNFSTLVTNDSGSFVSIIAPVRISENSTNDSNASPLYSTGWHNPAPTKG